MTNHDADLQEAALETLALDAVRQAPEADLRRILYRLAINHPAIVRVTIQHIDQFDRILNRAIDGGKS